MTNPLMARFTGLACAALVGAGMQAQFDACLHQANAQMQTPEFQAAERADTSDDFWSFAPDSYMARLRPYVVRNGILQIPVKGVLLNNFPFALATWATGYDYIWRAFERGMADPDVQGIALICDTPGGMVAGNFELVDKMFALRGTKPVRGYAAEAAYSAGYSIISVADPKQITVSRTGGVGSIGVVTGHLNVSGAMDKAGLEFTYVFAGAHKVDGNPYESLSDDVKARIQSRINTLYDVFVSTVARNRGLSEQAVRDTEALCFTASEALSNGLADKIGALDDALADYVADLTTPDDEEEEDMTTPAGSVDKATHDQAVTAARTEGHTAGRTEGHAAGLKEGATGERTRVNAILDHAEAKERPIAAMATAMHSGMSVEEAGVYLARLPKEAKVEASTEAGGSPFRDAMNQIQHPNVGAGAGGGDAASQDSADPVMAIVRAAGLNSFQPAKK